MQSLLNTKLTNGDTLLHKAIRKDQERIVEDLYSFGADFQCVNDNGKTPLDLALFNINASILETVLVSVGETLNDDTFLETMVRLINTNNAELASTLLHLRALGFKMDRQKKIEIEKIESKYYSLLEVRLDRAPSDFFGSECPTW